MKISQIRDSKYLKKEDCGSGILVTFSHLTQENLAMEGQPEELKWIMHFRETNIKPMALNSTNAQLIAAFMGSEETDDWTGRPIVLYADPSISFGGKLTGGIRARAPRTRPAPAPATAPPTRPKPSPAQAPTNEAGEVDPDDVPF